MAMFMFWTQLKGKQAKAAHEKAVADSLARVAAMPKTPVKGEASLGPVAGDSMQATREAIGVANAPAESGMVADSIPQVARKSITVKTHRFTAVLENEGARISELRIDSLQGHALHNPLLIDPARGGALTLSINQQSLAKTLWRTDAVKDVYTLDRDSLVLSFTTRLNSGREVTRRYTFFADSPSVHHRAKVPNGIQNWSMEWPAGLSENEDIPEGKGIGLMSSYFSEVVFDNGSMASRETFDGKKSFNAESGILRWVGLRRKYVAAFLDFHKETGNRVDAEGSLPQGREKGFPHDYRLKISNGQWDEGALDFDFMILPLQYDKIKAYGRNYEQILFTGWESFFRADIWYVKLCGLVLHLLNFFHSMIPNWGIAIILLTLLVRFITLPLTLSQTRQMARMQEHQPEINKIRERNKGEPAKAQQEMMAYYKQVGISPLAPVLGCFPMLLQMPIFIALFNVLGRSVELKQAYFFGWIHDLSQPDVILPALKVPYLFPVGLTVLPFLMAVTMYFQMKLTIKDPNQKAMVWLMPIMMFVFSCSFPSGLVLYWSVSNVFTITQTWLQTSKKRKAESEKAAAAMDKPVIKTKPIVGTRPKDGKKK